MEGHESNNRAGQQTNFGAEAFAEFRRLQKLQQRKRVWITLAILLAGALITLGWWQFTSFQHNRVLHTRIPAELVSNLGFPIYVPSDTSHYSYGSSSFQYSSATLSLQVKTNSGQTMVLNEQAKPESFQLAPFATSQDISESKQTNSPNGNAIMGVVNGHQVFILEAGKTIITAVFTSQSTTGSLTDLLNNLTKVDN